MKQLAAADIPAIAALWNEVMVNDPLTEGELSLAILGDGNHNPETTWLATEGDAVLGFCVAVVPSGQTEAGHVPCICGKTPEVVAEMLGAAEAFLSAKGVCNVRCSEYGGCEIGPGIDPVYAPVNAGFGRAGWTNTHTLDDMEIEVAGYEPTPRQVAWREKARAAGVRVVDADASHAEALKRFAARAVPNLPEGWFGEGWETAQHLLAAMQGDEAVGFANYWPHPKRSYGRFTRENCGAFGPIGVYHEARGLGIGIYLLTECQIRIRDAGHEWMWAGWTNTGFYIPNGWHVSRVYNVWAKDLTTGR